MPSCRYAVTPLCKKRPLKNQGKTIKNLREILDKVQMKSLRNLRGILEKYEDKPLEFLHEFKGNPANS